MQKCRAAFGEESVTVLTIMIHYQRTVQTTIV